MFKKESHCLERESSLGPQVISHSQIAIWQRCYREDSILQQRVVKSGSSTGLTSGHFFKMTDSWFLPSPTVPESPGMGK